MTDCLLEMSGITKRFPGVLALDDVQLSVAGGEVVALLGENGAGKSTLMKILSGVYQRDEGEVIFDGKARNFANSKDANAAGIAIIHQELNLISEMTVYENIYLGRELRTKLGLLDKKAMIEGAKELLALINVQLDPARPVKGLSIAMQQMVEIAKALSLNTKLIVMDEPTDALPDEEVDSLLKIIDTLRSQGKGIIYITHRLQEVFRIANRVIVLRDGKYIASKLKSELELDDLVNMMVGRELTEQFPYVLPLDTDEVILSVRGLSNNLVHDISFDVKKGSIVGVAGLAGAGRTELAKTLCGVYKADSGEVILSGRPVKITSPKQAISAGLYYLSEDRKAEGLVLGLDVKTNITLAALKKITTFGFVKSGEEKSISNNYKADMNIKTPSINQLVKNLSGGNQQKVVLSKGLMCEPELLILDEPTRGIDVGAKKEIYGLTNRLKESGKAILFISSEMPELLGVCDSILVMHEGRIKGSFTRAEATQEKIMDTIMA